jgi:ATP/maltotriose-dependent transcriptional regulator MalT
MPKNALYTLVWSSSYQAYELYKGLEEEVLYLVPDSSARLEWVNELSSFAFHGQHGSYTARKERKQRGEEYWYAYARVEGKLTKRYLGRSNDLALPRLEQVAQELRRNRQDVLLQIDHAQATHHSRSNDLPDLIVPGTTMPTVPAPLPLHSVQQQGNVLARKTPPGPSHLQTSPLLTTKLHMPHLPAQLVHRPRLIQRLQYGLERSLILLSAPAGFGKSTLLADWLASNAIPATWLSLEPQDNAPARFLSYLLAALQTYDAHLGKNARALLHPLHAPPLDIVLTLLLNDLMDKRADAQDYIVLILDDYHVITNEAIHQTLFLLLDHLPPQMLLVLATREDPPLPLARLRGRDTVVELRAADLQFTPEETAAYLVGMMGLPLSAEQSRLLQLRTEGWVTGLQLAAHSLHNHDDPEGFITAFSGSHRYVMDYLLEEVLNRQPQVVQDFLLQTCILDRLSTSLCDAVRAEDGSQDMLDFLERANVFLVALDDDRQWYRYHRLFAQVLRQRLQQTTPTLVPTLHQRASLWYEQHELFTEAISQALAASDFAEVGRLIEQHASVFILGDQMQTLYEWLQVLPESLMLARPSLCLVHALALMYTNHLEEASARLQLVERGLVLGEDNRQDAQRRVLLGQVIACQSILASLSGDLESSLTLSRQALYLLPATKATLLTHILHARAMFSTAHEYLVNGDVGPDSERLLMKLIGDTRASDYRLLTLKGLLLLARLRVLQGQLHQAITTYEEVVQVVSGTEELQALADSAVYYFGLGDLLRERNELEAAEQLLAQGMDLLKRVLSIEADKVWLGYSILARLQQARGRHDLALATLNAFVQLAQKRHIPTILMAQLAAMQAHVELAQGNLSAARHWADISGFSANDSPNYLHEREYLTLVRIRIAEKRITPTGSRLSEVLILLERLLADAEANKRIHSMLEVLLLYALALEVQGNHTTALTVLDRALTLAEPEGYVRLFLDEGRPMIALLRRAQRHGLAPNYIAKLLALTKEPEAIDIHPHTPTFNSLVEPLTAREREVLQLMLNGATNREIARELIVSVNTVKKHVLNICGKLNVRSRTQAIAKARKLHLL